MSAKDTAINAGIGLGVDAIKALIARKGKHESDSSPVSGLDHSHDDSDRGEDLVEHDASNQLIKDQMIIDGASLILQGLGVDINDHNFSTTPQRVLKVYKELFAPPETEMPSFDEDYTDIVVMKGAEFYTMCPHHMLPVKLEASIAYLPKGKVIGASKLIRMCYDANRGPMTQEKLTDEIIKKIDHYTHASSDGAAVLLRGHHGCFSIRGVRQHAASMVTAKFTGRFLSENFMQDRFYHLVNGGR